MPTYSYICEKCSYTFDAFQKINDDPLKKCPKCNKNSLRKKIGGEAVTFHFKGDGFYCTDNKKLSKKDPCSSCPNKKK